MRKILLGTTAVAGVALFGIADAQAQDAPTVRVGGYFRFGAAYISSQGDKNTPSGGGGVSGNLSAPPTQSFFGSQATLSRYDFQSDAEIHVLVSGKAANGLVYGATIELQVDQNGASGVGSSKTDVNTDEMYAFLRSPTLGELRMGDEDGPFGGLMFVGHYTGFASGGVDGDMFDMFPPAARPGTNFPGDVGDNTKIIYMSPQFFGFDFGASFAFNDAEGEDSGCNGLSRDPTSGSLSNLGIASCDRLSRGGSSARRNNEYQLYARYRGSFGPVGVALGGGYLGSGATRTAESTNNFGFARTAQGLSVGTVGAQVTAYGFTLAAHAIFGRSNNNYGLLPRTCPTAQGSSCRNNMEQYYVAIGYTFGDFTVGANWVTRRSEGSTAATADRRDNAFSVGATYRLAPGLELTAEYLYLRQRENGLDLNTGRAGIQDRITTNGFMVQTRLAF